MVPGPTDRHAEIGKRLHADAHDADLLVLFVDVLVDQQRLACLEDLACQAFAESERGKRFAGLIGEVDQVRLCIEQGQVGDIGVEDLARLAADQLDQAVQFRFGHQRLADGADRREFGRTLLFGIEKARVFEGDAHAAGQRLQQAHIRFSVGLFCSISCRLK